MAPSAHPESFPASGVPKMGSSRQGWGLAMNPALLSAQGTARPTGAHVSLASAAEFKPRLTPPPAQCEIGANEPVACLAHLG